MLAYLRLVANPGDELSLLRVINVPPRGIGRTTVERALALAAKHALSVPEVLARGREFPELQPAAVDAAGKFLATLGTLNKLTRGARLVELVKQLVRSVDYMAEIRRCYPDEKSRTARAGALEELMNMAELHGRGRKGADLTSFLEDVTLSAAEDQQDEEEPDQDAVTLMTLHSAKGLEFEQVYLVGMEEGLLPHVRSAMDGAIEEERRLAYVGMTRARRRLTLSLAKSRARYGRRAPTMPSRFLYEMHGKSPPLEQMDAALRAMNGTPPAKNKRPRGRRRKGPAR